MEAPQAPDLTCKKTGAMLCPRGESVHTHTAAAVTPGTLSSWCPG
jgi:hypothetical protein